MKIALAGNPNSGKTTLFNAITGKIEHVGNWPGVTVEKKEGIVKEKLNPQNKNLLVVDLPGAYSLNAYTSEESITSDFIKEEKPDVLINIVDSTNLDRSLFLTTQLLELGIPVVVALNKKDLVKKKGININKNLLSEKLKCSVVETASIKLKDNGLKDLIDQCIKAKLSPVPTFDIGISKVESKEEGLEADKERFIFVKNLVKEVETERNSNFLQIRQDKIDKIITHRWLGIPIFIVIIYLIFSISQVWIGPLIADFLVGFLEQFQGAVADMFASANPLVTSLLVDGIIGGTIAVIGFLPLIMIMFFLMSLLEDCGYMARIAVIMDRYFKKIGLTGKSIIPMITGTACGIPGVMSSRIIKDERQRRTTAMLTPFMPCGAKLPIIALFSGVFFAGNALVGTSMYFLAILIIIIGALIIRKITGDTSQSYFIIELPEYRIPSFKRATISMLSRAKFFIIKAATIILICNTVIQVMQTFDWSLAVAQTPSDSILASVSGVVAIFMIPLGFGMWQYAAATVTGFIAKENVVGTLAVVFGISNFIDTQALELVPGSAQSVESAFAITSVAALSFLVFNLFTPPCFACISAIRAEVDSPKWTMGAIGFQLAVGYTLSFLIYQIGTIITQGTIGSGFFPGFVVEVLIFTYIGYLMKKGAGAK